MKIYNQNKDRIENNPKVVTIDGVTMLWSASTEEQRVGAGYYPVKYESKPNTRYYTSKEQRQLVGNEYVISYISEPIDIETLKDKMKQEVIEIAKSKLDEATAKYSPAEMASWENLEREAIAYTQGAEIELCTMLKNEADMCGQTYDDLANEVIINANNLRDLRTYIVSTRYNKINEIKLLGSIEDIVLYEATPYEYTYTEADVTKDIDIVAGDTVIRYKNNLTAW
jgi:hypothetical protein